MQDQSYRSFLTWRVAVIPEGASQAIQGRAKELNLQGAGIVVPHPLPPQSRCKLIFEIPTADRKTNRYVEAQATVTFSSLMGGRLYRTGFRMQDIHPEHRAILEQELR